MEQTAPSIFDETEPFMLPPRKALLPWWITFFCWFFLIVFPLRIIMIFVPFFINIDLSMYGIFRKESITFYDVCWYSNALLTAIVAYALLKEKRWAVDLGIIIGSLATLLNVYAISNVPSAHPNADVYWTFYGLNIILLAVYLWKLFRIRQDWNLPR